MIVLPGEWIDNYITKLLQNWQQVRNDSANRGATLDITTKEKYVSVSPMGWITVKFNELLQLVLNSHTDRSSARK